MRDFFGKLLSVCLATLVLVAFVGCGEEKSPPRYVDDKDVKNNEPKPGAR
ncbi:MAG: hypothetical protein WD894_05570 [Pirellulales bacterium]